jgi:polyketide cyclase/dehydrase/lipid transport protein
MSDRRGSAGGTGVIEELPTTERLPTERLAQEAQNFLDALAEKALASISERLGDSTDRLIDYLEHGGPGVKSAVSGVRSLAAGKSPFRAAMSAGFTGLKEQVKQMFGRGGGGKTGLKLTNIVEQVDVGVPIRLAYDQWAQFEDFPSFMKKVESAERESDEKIKWRAQVWWSHRNWESTIVEQVPDEHIVWRSKGPKGYVDGVVTFSSLAPNLTRVLLVLEYHPQGFFEHTGNLWRAQGRRARLELKHFRRHVMAHVLVQPDEIEGWRGEIRDGEVVRTHEEAIEQEERDRKQREAEWTGERAAEEAAEEPEEPEESAEEPEEPEEEREEPAESEEEEREEPAEEPEEPEDRAEPEVRRRRPPAQRRAPAARRGPDEHDEHDEHADEDEAAARPTAGTRGRAAPRRRSGAR